MTINDNWLIERARQKKAASNQNLASLRQRLDAVFEKQIDALWRRLQAETNRQAGVYNKALGEPSALTVTGDKDQIEVRALDGRQLTIRLEREHRALTERFRTRGGLVRIGRPRIQLLVNSAGQLAFNFGAEQAAAGSILRRMIE